MYRIAIIHTPQSAQETDLYRMVNHLEKVLSEVKNVEVDRIVLEAGNLPDLTPYPNLVFCGYDHLTLAHLHLALDSVPTTTRITLYDEPGRSLKSELDSILFRGVDTRRIPASSLSAVEYSWSYRDIVSIATRQAREFESKSGKPGSGSRKRANSPRQVETTGNTSPSKGDASSPSPGADPL